MIYQLFDAQSSTLVAVLTFLPQWLAVIAAGFMFYYDLWLCLLVQTWSFVIFNKVMTAQYYLWYFCLMPITLINSDLANKNFKKLLTFCVLWGLG